jgi:hypothetical protein
MAEKNTSKKTLVNRQQRIVIMKKEKPKRTTWLTIRLTAEEAIQLETFAKQSTSASLSDYARRVLLQKPVSIRYRNQSLDDFLADMTRMRNDLNSIGNNFNQSVHRLHTLQSIPEMQQWVLLNEQDKNRVLQLIETISTKLNAIYQLWSHV